MSNQTNLDWLARNVHEWPCPHQDTAFVGHEINCLGLSVKESYKGLSPSNVVKITHQQWLARRAELQNKPGWHEWPQRKFMAQSKNGHWVVSDRDLYPGDDGMWHYDKSQDGGVTSRGIGEVLGDWRDTLERRPTDLSEQAVTARLQEAADNVLAAVPELKQDRFKFEPLISIEDNQGKVMAQHEEEKQQDNSWFERGELPPAGVECEFRHPGFGWVGCDIVGHYRYRAVCAPDGGGFYGGVADEFRPIRTERDKAIEQALKDSGALECETVISIIENLLDKGWVKEPK